MTKNQKIITSLLLLTFFDGYKTFPSTQFKIIRGNATHYTTEDVQREEDLEYPRKNARIIAILREKWKNYYNCLQKKENQEKKPEIRRLLEGQYTEFQCDFCPRPFQNYDDIEWKYKPLSPDIDVQDVEYLDLTPEMTLDSKKTLQIFNAMENFAGLYACYYKKNVLSVYILEVSKNDTIEKVETLLIHGKRYIILGEKHYQIYYQWTDWTECNTCGRVGKKFKYGTCFISQKSGNFGNNKAHRTRKSPSKIIEYTDKADENLTQNLRKKKHKADLLEDDNFTTDKCINQNWKLEIIEKFSSGIPCASQYLPKIAFEFVKKHNAIKVLVKYCYEPCQENEIFEIIDSTGKIVEIANNTAGIYSVFQKLPRLSSDLERRSTSAEFGKDITIHCPGTSLTNTSVIWKVNNKIVFPDIIANESNGRFTIDLVNRIHIKKLRLKDSQIYSCWQKGRLVGTVHLNVEKKFKINFDHHVTLIVIVLIIGAFLMVGSKILKRELTILKN